MMRLTLLFFAAIFIATAKSEQAKCRGRYEACHEIKPGFVNVHLIPHTHNDLGWLKTVDQYYYGSRNDIQRAGVQYILDGVVQELIRDPTKRFVWVETAFLWQWWQEQDDTLRDKVRELVNNGQLEIAGGGWSMNDEAVTHYQSTIDQFTWGFRKLDEMLGTCARPHVGWQLDAFGHSSETASIMAQMGFDALFFARLDTYDKARRLEEQTLEFMWKPSPNLGNSSWLFTHVLYDHYSAPTGQCYDLFCDDEPFVDNYRSPEYNAQTKTTNFINYVTHQWSCYKTDNVMEMMGNDFNFQVAGGWFKNMDKLIKYVNERQSRGSRVNVFYSTPSCYLKAVHDANITDWSSKKDDFFPYANNGLDYWTGYYTSRPTLKFFERQGNNLLQTVKRLFSLANLGPESWTDVSSLREIMGILQHHDAITGTEKQHVADDYALRLNIAFEEAHATTERALNKLMAKSKQSPVIDMKPCLLLNVSQCAVSENSEAFVVIAFNPLARSTSKFIRLPVPTHEYKVFDPAGMELTIQMVPIPPSVIQILERKSKATQELIFKAENIPPLGFKSYYVQLINENITHLTPEEKKFSIGNTNLQAHLNTTTGRLSSITVNDINFPVQQNFLYYESFFEDFGKSSGAYMFRPQPGQEPLEIDTRSKFITVYSGPHVEEIHQEFSYWVSQVIRIYKGQNHVEFEWKVGPIPGLEHKGKEVITRFSTGWDTKSVFYTDSNGREMMKRTRDYRETWDLNNAEPVSGNYYPVTTAISIKNDNYTLAVLPDRAQGGSSITDGDLELMVHRRVFRDDEFGVDEPLDEQAYGAPLIARGRHILLVGSSGMNAGPSIAAQQRQLSQSEMVLAPWLLFAPAYLTVEEWQQNYVTEYSGMQASLPANVHLLTLEPWVDGSLLLRLEHFLEKSDDKKLSLPATVYLEDLFSAFTVVSAQETSLGGNQALEEMERLHWNVPVPRQEARTKSEAPTHSNKFAVTLQPMQIRTFIINIVVPKK